MAFNERSLQEIYTDLEADCEATLQRYPNRRSLINVLIKVLAGASHGWIGRLRWVLDQTFVATADEGHLTMIGQQYGVYRKAAVKASGAVTFTFTADPVAVEVGTILTADNGQQYSVTTAVTSAGTANVEALVAGVNGNLNAGVELQLTPAVDGVVNAVVTDGGISGGVEQEDLEDYRTRVKKRLQNPPGCGKESDYEQWALEVPGVTRAWCQPHTPERGEITLRFMTDGLTDDGFPDEDKIAEVQAYVDSVNPTEARVYCCAPVKKVVDITINALDPDTVEVKDRINERLKELFVRQSTLAGTIKRNRIIATVTDTSGVENFELAAPAADITASTDELAVLGEVTYGD